MLSYSIRFLLSDQSKSIRGQNLVLDYMAIPLYRNNRLYQPIWKLVNENAKYMQTIVLLSLWELKK